MTPNGLKNAIRGWMVTLFLILTFLLVWYLCEPPKEGLTRNKTLSLTQQNITHKRSRRSTDHGWDSVPWIVKWTYDNAIRVTVAPNNSTVLTIPIKNPQGILGRLQICLKRDCVVCMSPRPILQVIPAIIPQQCVIEVMNKTNPNSTCSSWDSVFPITKATAKKPVFSKKVAPGNFTCVNMTGSGQYLSNLSESECTECIITTANLKPVSPGDIWWWCGDDRIFDRFPANVTGLYALVTLLLPVSIYPISVKDLTKNLNAKMPQQWHLKKRAAAWRSDNDPTCIDAIGVPRGVPDEYKLDDQVAAGFESSICWWCTINKNVDRINYIHYNVQKLGNWTEAGFEAVHGQLAATSLMTFQNRIAVVMLLAEKGGVCAMFGERCCTFIPNNTAADGSLTKAIEGLRTLNGKMKDHSGVDTTMWDSWMDAFGKYRTLVSSVLVSIAVFAAVLTLCGYCCIHCIRSLLNRLITTAISPMGNQIAQMYPLLGKTSDGDTDSEDDDAETTYYGVPDLLPNPGDCE
uniref:Envelope polyprotein n=1 Tax=Seriola lalandi dorsalis TaxID=1841481 RepID=A0A3B4XH62_SERLL